MRKFNYYKWFIRSYNFMPRPVQFCIRSVVRRSHGGGWYGLFVLKAVLHRIENMTIEEYEYYYDKEEFEKVL
jgi:hypothetical protein